MTTNRIGTCRINKAHRFLATTDAEQATACPTCAAQNMVNAYGQPFRPGIVWKAVQGRTSAKKCTGSCSSAASVVCSCQCGGHNHGKALELAA